MIAAAPITAPVPEIIISLSVSILNGPSDERCENDTLQKIIIDRAVMGMDLKKFISKGNNNKLNCFVFGKV
jgi:hypothetical protein